MVLSSDGSNLCGGRIFVINEKGHFVLLDAKCLDYAEESGPVRTIFFGRICM